MIRLGVLGDPLAFTLSPVLHRAALDALDIEGDSQPFPTPIAQLGTRLEDLAHRGWRGVSLTHPLKEEALSHVRRTGGRATKARSVNTVRFDEDGWLGESTDGTGFIDWIQSLGRDPRAERVMLLGAGGAARSVAEALLAEGAAVGVGARSPMQRVAAWSPLVGARLLEWGSSDWESVIGEATLVVNATPVSSARAPIDPAAVPDGALVVDLVYGPELSAWAAAARAAGRTAYDGLGLLIHQARRAFEIWVGQLPSAEPLARAVGWPR